MKTLRQVQQHNNRKGFTLAELLVTVGILAILLSLTLVAVNAYNSRLKLLQMDNTAKDIFIVAQNHLTAAEVSGKLGVYVDDAGISADGRLGTQMGEEPSDFTDAKADAGLSSDLTWNDGDYYYIDYYPSTNANAGGNSTSANTQKLDDTILKYMLPNASIQDDIRTMDHYIIEYNAKTGNVYGVFYTDSSKGLTYSDVTALSTAGGRADTSAGKEARRTYSNSKGKDIIGYYGGAMADSLNAADMSDLSMKITNADTLKVEITDPNYFKTSGSLTNYYYTSVTVTVKGVESGKEDTFMLDLTDNAFKPTKKDATQTWWDVDTTTVTNADYSTTKALKYTLTLDDITTPGGHFADICHDLIPGEDIVVTAACSSKTVLSGVKTVRDNTNSLFATSAIDYDATAKKDLDTRTVSISSIRHLENLDPDVSGVPTKTDTAEEINFYVAGAVQTADLDWDEFKASDGATSGRDSICQYGLNTTTTGEWLASNSYYGINNPALTSYNGSKKSISNMVITNTAGNAGLFRTISSKKMTVSNLMLKNFQVSGTTGAGALSGSVKAITAEEANGAEPVVNVLNVGVSLTSGTSASDTADSRYASGSYTIKASAGSAGGLIGSSGRETHIVNSFASVPVRATVSAGGLIGEITTGGTEDSTIKNSYSSGRTVSGKYDTAAYNVTSTTGSAGGLIGTITAPTDFTSDYSTCSVSASAYGGGFIGIGTASGTSFVSCYDTGLISTSAAAEGGFAGRLAAGSGSGTFMDGITSGISGIGSNTSGVTASAVAYDTMAAASTNKATAAHTVVYDSTHSGKAYPFTAVNGTGFDGADYAHWGDWPDKPVTSTITGTNMFAYREHMKGDPENVYHWHIIGAELDPSGKVVVSKTYDDLVTANGKYVDVSGYGLLSTNDKLTNTFTQNGNKVKPYVNDLSNGVEVTINGNTLYYYSLNMNQYSGHQIYDTPEWRLGNGNGPTVTFQFNPDFAAAMKVKTLETYTFGTSGHEYQVRTSAQLNNVYRYPSKYFIQTCDIDLNKTAVTVIGSANASFTGSYDATGIGGAKDYSIYNYLNTKICGLFGYAKGAAIKGVNIFGTITDADISTIFSRPELYIGGLIDSCGISGDNGCTVTNCNANVDITLSKSSNVWGEASIGGLIGKSNNTDCSNSTSKGVIKLTNSSIVNAAYYGGLAGYSSDSKYINCDTSSDMEFNSATVSSGLNAGGFLGYSSNDTIGETMVSGYSCTASGDIAITKMTVPSGANIGGFAGSVENTEAKFCKAAGNVTIGPSVIFASGFNAAAFAGNAYNCNISNCQSTGNVTINNQGSSNKLNNTANIGGIAGYSSSNTIKSSKTSGTMDISVSTVYNANIMVGGFTGYSEYDALGTDTDPKSKNISDMDININISANDYPKLYVGGFTGYSLDSEVYYGASTGSVDMKNSGYNLYNGAMYVGGFAGYAGNDSDRYNQIFQSCWSKESIANAKGYSAGMAGYANYVQFIDCYAATKFDGTSAARTFLFANDTDIRAIFSNYYSSCYYTYCHGIELDTDGKPITSSYKFRNSIYPCYSEPSFMALTSAADGYYYGYYYGSLDASTEDMATLKAYFAADVQNGVSHWITDDTVAYPQLASFPESAAVTAQSVKASARKAKLALTSANNAEGASVPDIMKEALSKTKGIAEMKFSMLLPAGIIKQIPKLNN